MGQPAPPPLCLGRFLALRCSPGSLPAHHTADSLGGRHEVPLQQGHLPCRVFSSWIPPSLPQQESGLQHRLYPSVVACDPSHEQPRALHQLAAIFRTLGWSPFHSEVPKEAGGRSHVRPREEISAGTEKRALEFLVPLPIILKGAPHSCQLGCGASQWAAPVLKIGCFLGDCYLPETPSFLPVLPRRV